MYDIFFHKKSREWEVLRHTFLPWKFKECDKYFHQNFHSPHPLFTPDIYAYIPLQVEIRDSNDAVLLSQTIPDLLSCFEVREFWVSYASGTIILGRTLTQRLVELDYGLDDVVSTCFKFYL